MTDIIKNTSAEITNAGHRIWAILTSPCGNETRIVYQSASGKFHFQGIVEDDADFYGARDTEMEFASFKDVMHHVSCDYGQCLGVV